MLKLVKEVFRWCFQHLYSLHCTCCLCQCLTLTYPYYVCRNPTGLPLENNFQKVTFLVAFFGCFCYIYDMSDKRGRPKVEWSLELINKTIEEEGIKSLNELKDKHRAAYSYLYNHECWGKCPLMPAEKRGRVGNIMDTNYYKVGRRKDWYDIEPILPYLERWSEQENTTVRYQAQIGCLLPEFEQYKKDHPEYIME